MDEVHFLASVVGQKVAESCAVGAHVGSASASLLAVFSRHGCLKFLLVIPLACIVGFM
jgi:hypothetical protein